MRKLRNAYLILEKFQHVTEKSKPAAIACYHGTAWLEVDRMKTGRDNGQGQQETGQG